MALTYVAMAEYVKAHPIAGVSAAEVDERLQNARLRIPLRRSRRSGDTGTDLLRRANAQVWLAKRYEATYRRETGKNIHIKVRF